MITRVSSSIILFQDMKGTLAQELDFVNEGQNSERCQRDLQHLGYVYVPQVHWDKTSTVSNSTHTTTQLPI